MTLIIIAIALLALCVVYLGFALHVLVRTTNEALDDLTAIQNKDRTTIHRELKQASDGIEAVNERVSRQVGVIGDMGGALSRAENRLNELAQ